MENSYALRDRLFTNKVIDKRQLKGLMSDLFNKYGPSKCTYVADKLKFLGFHYATQAGLSLNVEDLRVPDTKRENLIFGEKFISEVEESFTRADITSVDRFQYIIDKWSAISDKVKEEVVNYFVKTDPFNPIYMMAFSGARGNLSQVRQLIGMRGLMADPQGQLIGLPIKSNFREGLTVTEYIISSYGARKGIVDTALRTADSGYLTRRLVDVSQDIIVRAHDCGTNQGIKVETNSNITLEGRTLLKDLYDSEGRLICLKNKQIDQKTIQLIVEKKIKFVEIRSSITCNLNHSVCQLCYGWNLATRKLIDLGEAVGILAAQSIGEPGTQLTMRTFHTGGTFMGTLSDAKYSFSDGKLSVVGTRNKYIPEKSSESGWNIRVKKDSFLQLKTKNNRLISLDVPANSTLPFTSNGLDVKRNEVILKPPISQSTGSEQVTKRILSDKEGLVCLDSLDLKEVEDKNRNITLTAKNQGFIWICSSNVLSIPTNAEVEVKKNNTIRANKCFVKVNLANTYGGFYAESKNQTAFNILLTSYNLKDSFVEASEDGKFVLKTKEKEVYNLFFTKESYNDHLQVIGESKPKLSFSYSSGRIKIEHIQHDSPQRAKIKQFDSYIHLIPEYYFTVISSSKQIFVKAGDFVEKGFELFTGTFAEQQGIVDILEVDENTFDIILRPGVIFDSDSPFKNAFSKNNKKIISYPEGLDLGNNFSEPKFIYIEQLVFEEDKQSYLISPVETSCIPHEKEIAFTSNHKNSDFQKPFRLFEKTQFLVNEGDIIRDLSQTNLALKQLIIKFNLIQGRFNANIKLQSLDSTEMKFDLKVDIYERLNISFEKLSTDYIKNQKLIHENQYIYGLSKAYQSQVFSEETSLINSVESISSNKKLLCLAKKSDFQVFRKNTDKNLSLKFSPESENKFFRRGDKFTNNLLVQAAGRLIVENFNKKDLNFTILQRAKPYLIATESILKTKQNYLVRKNDLIAFLTYEVAKTEDIIQGLPRVEELLEARPPKSKAIIATIPGYVSVVSKVDIEEETANDLVTIVIKNYGELEEKYTLPRLRKVVKTGDFVNLGDRLTDGQPDLRELLQVYFEFYSTVLKLDNYSACLKSFKKIQILLIFEIQNVYKSQGVDISDKHIEIIVRQMTQKVRVEDSGKTTLVPGELVDLEKIRRINAIANYQGYETATYTPILLGITKASLSTDSFISAASFQETARVLTKAAVEGKKDWLKGLKENVIVGRLIPAGTGFKLNQESIQTNLNTNPTNPQDYNIDDLILDKRLTNRE